MLPSELPEGINLVDFSFADFEAEPEYCGTLALIWISPRDKVRLSDYAFCNGVALVCIDCHSKEDIQRAGAIYKALRVLPQSPPQIHIAYDKDGQRKTWVDCNGKKQTFNT